MKYNGIQLQSQHSDPRGREGIRRTLSRGPGGWIVPLAAACCGLVLLAALVLFAIDQLNAAPVKSPAASRVSSDTDKRAERPDPTPIPTSNPVPASPESVPAEPAPAGGDVTARNTCTNGQCTSCVNADCDALPGALPDALPGALPGGIDLPSLPKVSNESKARATTCIDGRCKTVES